MMPPQCFLDSIALDKLAAFGIKHPKAKWRIQKCGYDGQRLYLCCYITVEGKSKKIYAHRLIFGALPGETIDHINRNSLDNRLSNLRSVTAQMNALNASYPNGSTGFRGIDKRGEKYRVRVGHGKRRIYVGLFNSLSEAKQALQEAEEKIRDAGYFSHRV